MNYCRSQATVYGRRCPEANRRIQIIHALPRSATIWIGNTRFHADAVAGFQVGYLFTHLYDYPSGFMAENHRLTNLKRPDGAVLIVVHIAAADSNATQSDAHVVRSERVVDGDIAKR